MTLKGWGRGNTGWRVLALAVVGYRGRGQRLDGQGGLLQRGQPGRHHLGGRRRLFGSKLVAQAVALEVQLLVLQAQALGGEVAPVQFGQVGAELAQEGPSHVSLALGELACHYGVARGQPEGQGFREGWTVLRGQLRCVLAEALGQSESFLLDQPVAVTALFPVGEILGIDRAALEISLQDGMDLGQSVEPFEQAGAGLAVEQALVELVAEGAGEPGDFTVAGHRGKRLKG